jgi:sulfur relay (sulfurtransferase) DsrF/TusC family protein
MSDVQTEYFASTVHKNGKGLEDRAQQQLLASRIQHKRNTHSGIDFIIDGEIYMDCVATNQSGSIDDKIPTKCFKYIKKYSIKELYILHPYSPIEKNVAELLEHLEKTMDVKIHMLSWDDFTHICNGGRFEIRKPYVIVRSGKGSRNHKAATIKVNKWFDFKN